MNSRSKVFQWLTKLQTIDVAEKHKPNITPKRGSLTIPADVLIEERNAKAVDVSSFEVVKQKRNINKKIDRWYLPCKVPAVSAKMKLKIIVNKNAGTTPTRPILYKSASTKTKFGSRWFESFTRLLLQNSTPSASTITPLWTVFRLNLCLLYRRRATSPLEKNKQHPLCVFTFLLWYHELSAAVSSHSSSLF